MGTVYFLEASKMWKVETEDAGNRTPGSIRGVTAADPVRKGSHGGGSCGPPLWTWLVRQLQGRMGQIKSRLLNSCARSQGWVPCLHPPSLSGRRRASPRGPCLAPITPTSPPPRDSAGPLLCGLLSSPDVLLCHVRDWRDPAEAQANASCPGVTYDQDSRQVTLRLGGQEIGGKCLLSSRVRSFTATWAHQQGLLLCWEPSLYPEEFILPKRICTKMLH